MFRGEELMAIPREKLDRGVFKHVESLLAHFWDYKAEVEKIREEIIQATPSRDNIGGGRGNLPGDPVGKMVVALAEERRLKYLAQAVDAISAVYSNLPEAKKELVRLRYWDKPQRYTWEGIALEIKISRRQALRWRNEIIYQIARRLGWM